MLSIYIGVTNKKVRQRGFLYKNVYPTRNYSPPNVIFMKAALRLFKAILIRDKDVEVDEGKVLAINKELIVHGLIFSPEIIANYSSGELKRLVNDAIRELGLSSAQMNSSFHKSWKKVESASLQQLFIEQILHYITTYGFEQLGIYHKDSVYIPREKLEIPEIEEDILLTVVKAYTKKELMGKLLHVLSSGIALKGDTLQDVIEVATYLEFKEDHLSQVANNEARVMLYDYLDILPSDPVEFIRFMVYQITETTLLIKNRSMAAALSSGKNLRLIPYFRKYDEKYGFKKLARIFNRFKPIFLSLKTNNVLNNYINIISKLSKKYHVPLKEDYLNNITAKLKKGITPENFKERIENASVFRKIRLLYALKYRMVDPTSILYRIRNGKAYATEFKFPNPDVIPPYYEIVYNSILGDIKNVKGKKIYIPEHTVYALPSSEKQFSGNIPSGSFIEAGKDVVIGVHWKNYNEQNRTDLDLALLNVETKIGWDRDYRNEDKTILFSGDVTDAPNEGASELFYIKKGTAGNYILTLNYYNYSASRPIPITLIIAADKKIKKFESNYMVDPNTVVCKSKSKIVLRQKTLGLLMIDKNSTKFFFFETAIGNVITSSMKDYMKHTIDYLTAFYSNPINFNEFLEKAGAEIVLNVEDADIDLSIENIDKESFLNLLK